MTLVLGVVTREPHDPDNWAYLQELDGKGIEIASHTVNHYDLERVTSSQLCKEIEISYQHICDGVGKCPETLILPFGKGAVNEDVLSISFETGYLSIVTIGGSEIFGGNHPHILKRVPPDNFDQLSTITILNNSSNSNE